MEGVADVRIVDEHNNIIQGVTSFDTVTKNATILLFSTDKTGKRWVTRLNKIAKKVHCKLKGARAVNIKTGEELK
jgi:hypothetical protein